MPSHFENMMLAIRILQERGYRRIGFATPNDLRWRVMDAHLAAYSLYNRFRPVENHIPVYYSDSTTNEIALEWLSPSVSLSPNPMALDAAGVAEWVQRYAIDALICNYSPTVKELEQVGISIPKDLGYVSLDTTSATSSVSGIDQRPRAWGIKAVDSVTSRIMRNEYGEPEVAFTTTVRGQWIEGKSLK